MAMGLDLFVVLWNFVLNIALGSRLSRSIVSVYNLLRRLVILDKLCLVVPCIILYTLNPLHNICCLLDVTPSSMRNQLSPQRDAPSHLITAVNNGLAASPPPDKW